MVNPQGLRSLARWSIVLLPLYVLVPWIPIAGSLASNDLIPLLGAGSALVLIWDTRGHAPSFVPPMPWFALLLLGAYFLLAHVCSGQTGALGAVAARTLGRFGLYAFIGYAVQNSSNDNERALMANVLCGVVLFEATLGTVAALGGFGNELGIGVVHYASGHFPQDGFARAQGTFGGVVPAGEIFMNRANFYSAFLVVGLFVYLEIFAKRNTWLVGGMLVIGFGIIASGSRMSLGVALVGVIIWGGLRGYLRRLWKIGLALGFAMAMVPAIRGRFFKSSTDRLEEWRRGLEVMATAPGFGVGDGRYLEVARAMASAADGWVPTPHHSLIYAGASYGVLALIFLASLYVWLLKGAFDARREKPALFALTLVFIAHDMTNNLFFVPEVALSFWLCWALLAAKNAEPHA